MQALTTTIQNADPRYFQLAVLGGLVTFGVTALGLGIYWQNAVVIILIAQLTQLAGARWSGSSFDPRSALITALSLTLLLRTESLLLAACAALIAIGSKFVIRFDGKHIFNPANVAIVTLMLATDSAWISSGQWGNAAIGALALASLGLLVLTRAKRAETTIAFLAAYGGLLMARTWWLGDPLAISLHHLQNGALLIFAFFMISDPRTTPNSAAGRIFYGSLVATVAFVIQFVFYQPNGPILALIMASPLVPLINVLSKGLVYSWGQSPGSEPAVSIERMSKPKGAY